jgi:hypothetical protein
MHLNEFVGKRLKDIYHEGGKERLKQDEVDDSKLILEFENGFKIEVKGVGQSAFSFKTDRIDGEEEVKKKPKRKRKNNTL